MDNVEFKDFINEMCEANKIDKYGMMKKNCRMLKHHLQNILLKLGFWRIVGTSMDSCVFDKTK